MQTKRLTFRGKGFMLGMTFLLAASSAKAGMQEVLEAVRASEFRFARSISEVPFFPVGWVQDTYYPNAGFQPEKESLPEASVSQNAVSMGAVIPAYVDKRNMLLLGGDITLDIVRVKSGPFRDQAVFRMTPVAAWLNQMSPDDLVGLFVAPVISKEIENGGPWGVSGYGGVVAMHYFSDTMQLLYGGIYHNNFGRHIAYPYIGLNWIPDRKWSIALIFPWPAITHVPHKDWLLQVALSPGGGSWTRRRESYEVSEYLGSWNLQAGIGYRLHSSFWLVASGGIAGLRGWELGDSGGLRYEAKPSAVFSLAIQFRP